MTTTKERSELVEVHLFFELQVYIPAAGSNGELTYKKTDISPEDGLKVKVPSYATESKEALESFLQQEYENKGIDMYCPYDANILVRTESDKMGSFKFEWNAGFPF